ncbi:MotA/TolQ/ExbB proton channel family protein [Moritella sp. 5]|uniref:motility protein A n=1 Tax=Moritella sp. 5 TaxID=2746231 RepID=UPI001BA99EA3|nr:MotA/TolQ/ExbB proton channel family protein [Moritella sp. 5]QUM80914.1 MotA/TolQ/ExbB proton channel family protein [Moritella sp. 5]
MISISTFVGILGAVGLFVYAIFKSTDNYLIFVSLFSLLIVLGGTFGATLISYSFRLIWAAFTEMMVNLLDEKNQNKQLKQLVSRIIEWNDIYKKQGITALENSLTEKEKKDDFIINAMELLGTGYKSKVLSSMLDDTNESDFQRRNEHVNVINTLSIYAPSFGMVGTLIGLIIMLDNMSGDLSALGKGLAIALLTTLYGTLLAQLLFKPSAIRIARRQHRIFFERQIITAGLELITENKDNLYIQDRLNCYLAPKHKMTELGQ